MLFGQENDALMCGANSVCIDNVSITILQTFARKPMAYSSFKPHSEAEETVKRLISGLEVVFKSRTGLQ